MGVIKQFLYAFIACFLILVLFPFSASCWQYTYGGPGEDRGESVQQTADGGYIAAGSTDSSGAGLFDIFLVKTDADGNQTWTKTFGTASDDFGYSVKQTSDGGYIISGGNGDMILVKTDQNGNQVWYTEFQGYNDNLWSVQGLCVQQTGDDGYVAVGFGPYGGYPYSNNTNDICLLKADSNGNTQWSSHFGVGSENKKGYSVLQAKDGGYVICGSTNFYIDDLALIKTDSAGSMEWNKVIFMDGSDRDDEGHEVNETADGGYIIGGTRITDSLISTMYMIKTDINGNVQWQKTYDYGAGNSVQQTKDGGYILAGSSLIKTDGSGNSVWSRTYNLNTGIHSVRQTSDNGYIMTGRWLGHLCLIKVDEYGNDLDLCSPTMTPTITETFTITETWTITETTTVTPTLTATPSITVSSSMTVSSSVTQTNTVTPTITITQTCSITPSITATQTQSPVAKQSSVCFEVHSVNPNPANDRTDIVYETCNASIVILYIYNIDGELVHKSRGQSNTGFNTIAWDCRNDDGVKVSNGIYIYFLKASSGSDSLIKYGKIAIKR